MPRKAFAITHTHAYTHSGSPAVHPDYWSQESGQSSPGEGDAPSNEFQSQALGWWLGFTLSKMLCCYVELDITVTMSPAICFSNTNSLHSQMFAQDAIPSGMISLYTFPAISGVALLSIAHPWSVWRPTTVNPSCIVMWVMAYHIQPFFTLYTALGQGKTMLPPCQNSNIVSMN